MKFVCFNVNGIRARLHQLQLVKDFHDPDVIALQETKVIDDAFPLEEVQAIGYPHIERYGQKGHYGVALLSKSAADQPVLGIPWRDDDQQRRFISAHYSVAGKRYRVINGYFPQGESRDHATKFPDKRQFYADVTRYISEQCDPDESLIVTGDMNIAPEDIDIGIGEDNKKRWLRTGKTSFLPEEREWLDALRAWGLQDTYAVTTADGERQMSWFDYRSRGFERSPKRGLRIDLILASEDLRGRLESTGIDHAIRGSEKPSDHCPIWATFGP